MREAERIRKLPPYLFARIEKKIAEAKEKGVDIISLGIGDPDRPTPDHIIAKLVEEAHNPANHQYPSSVGLLEYRKAVAAWYKRRFGVELDPKTEVVTLIGSKEGIAHINFCYVDPGDINLVPDPGYPVYGIGTLLAGGEPYLMPLKAENGFLPDLEAIPSEVAKKAKLMFINYPNNPTGALATLDFYRDVVAFAKEYDVIVCHDAAYSEITFEGYKAPSFLQAPGAKEVGIEFNSLSKPYNMTGWRIGWAAGRADVIEALGRLKSNLDSGAFQAVQYAGIAGLLGDQECVQRMCEVYRERRDVVVDGLNAMGWSLEKPKATFYIWAPVPKGYTSAGFAEVVLEKAGVIVTPGNGYGEYGEGYFRISLCIEKERIIEALRRMQEAIGKVEF
ncbi:LL-diaminopimelate aminotransferase [Zhaonella formicivorans]|uniref:LL-diaminopimelate aminotransferase n=1 Tax=Zhaonella formicivorans TaxID=2528593 RepID=UPI0010D0BD09|nr:LL-diaminopimelate aminotransferase [Zhaonella formicivorans]